MKNLVILGVLLFAGACYAKPIDSPDHRWALTPDGFGKMHLVDMDDPQNMEPEPSFNAMNDVFFVLFTRRNRNAGQRLARTTASINNSQWNSAQGFRFIIHGWTNSHTSTVNIGITTELLNRADHNVVRVDWSAGSGASYATSRGRVPDVGAAVASFIDWLHLNNFLTFSRTHIIGHSLGAHAAGVTGKRVTRGRIQQIYGMDPAGPGYTMLNSGVRLASGDAVYTEMLATNAGGLGFDGCIAQACFYPNWGASQPGCGIDLSGNCAHSRAFQFYAESVNRDMFHARRCANHGQISNRNCPTGQGAGASMGGDVTRTWSGIFFLDVNSSSPFSRG